MDFASALIGVGGLLLGALTAYLSYLNQKDERKQAYRQIFYGKQVDGCDAVMKCAVQLYKDVSWLLREENQEKIQEVEEKVRYANGEFWDVAMQWTLFLPQNVNESMNEFGKVVGNIGDVRRLNQEEKDRIDKNTDTTFQVLLSAMRQTLGTEPLSSEAIGLLNTVNKDANQAFSERYVSRESKVDEMRPNNANQADA